jgi:Tol biopolymer transport system component
VIDEQLTIYLRDVANLAGQRLRPDGLMAAPFYSPDGSEIGFLNASDTTLKRASVDGSDTPETLFDYGASFPFGASWDGEGHIVFGSIADERGLLQVPDHGGPAEEITQLGPGEEHVYPEVLPGRRGILFTTILNEGAAPSVSIEVLDLSTNERRILIESGTQAQFLDAGIIVYNDEGTLRAVRFDIEALRVEGNPITVLEGVEYYAGSFGAQFDVSRSGSLVYMNRTSLAGATERRLAIVDVLGQREPIETRVAPYMHPRVSPDGTEIAVQTLDANNQGIIWIYNFEREALRQLSRAGSNVRPIWTPDGERIAFASNRDGNWGIYWQRADGSDTATRLTIADDGREHYPDSWSPDGRWLTYTDIVPDQGEMQSIWALDVTTGGADPVHLTEPVSGGLEFSVDGDWIAYRLNNQVVVEPFPQTGAVYQVTQAGGSYPVWSPVGTRLLYRRAVGAQGSSTSPLVMVDVSTEGAFTFGNERIPPVTGFLTFFGHRDYDFMPDGERLVMVFPSVLDEVSSEEFVPRINVVLHWVEELKERLAIE